MDHNADVTRVLDERSKQALAAAEVQRKHPVAESGERCPTIVQGTNKLWSSSIL